MVPLHFHALIPVPPKLYLLMLPLVRPVLGPGHGFSMQKIEIHHQRLLRGVYILGR